MRRDFTLIELIVVIAIVVLLMSLVLPALNQSRQSVRTSVCLTNLKQMGTAVYTYSADFSSRLPGPCYDNTYARAGSEKLRLPDYLANYVGIHPDAGTDELFPLLNCPSFNGNSAGTLPENALMGSTASANPDNGEKYLGYPSAGTQPVFAGHVLNPASTRIYREVDTFDSTYNNNAYVNTAPLHSHGSAIFHNQLRFDGSALSLP